MISVYQGISKHKMGTKNEYYIEHFTSYPCIRALLMLFNVVFWVCGLAILWIGIWMRTDFEIYLKINKNYSEWAPYVIVAIGTLIIFVSLLACTCIVKVHPTMLVIYGGFLITMLYTLISLSIYIYTYKDKLIDGAGKGLGLELKSYDLYSNYGNNKTMLDTIQKKLNCCGMDNYLDWERNKLPRSCCQMVETDEPCSSRSKTLYKMGCLPELHRLINTNFTTMGVTTSAIAFFPLFGTVFAFALAIMSGTKGGYERIA